MLLTIHTGPPFYRCSLNQSSLPGDPEIAAAIERYAQKVQQEGYHLEMLDAFVFATMAKKDLWLLIDSDKDEPLIPRNATWYVDSLLGAENGRNCDELNLCDLNSWVLISCNAQFDRSGNKNHWVPAFTAAQTGPDSFWDMTVGEEADAKSKVEMSKLSLQELEQDLADAPKAMDPEAKACLQSKIFQMQCQVQRLGHKNKPKSSKIGGIDMNSVTFWLSGCSCFDFF